MIWHGKMDQTVLKWEQLWSVFLKLSAANYSESSLWVKQRIVLEYFHFLGSPVTNITFNSTPISRRFFATLSPKPLFSRFSSLHWVGTPKPSHASSRHIVGSLFVLGSRTITPTIPSITPPKNQAVFFAGLGISRTSYVPQTPAQRPRGQLQRSFGTTN